MSAITESNCAKAAIAAGSCRSNRPRRRSRRLRRAPAAIDHGDAFQVGVGDTAGELSLSVTAEDVFSSFKPPNDYTAAKFGGARETGRELVSVVRLDEFIAEHPLLANNAPLYLKIDTQGFEREVLDGAGSLLGGFRAIQLELPLRTLYRGQQEWREIVDFMAAKGFDIAMAKENGFDWDAMRLLELDVVFVARG